jgi:hypothetical protein
LVTLNCAEAHLLQPWPFKARVSIVNVWAQEILDGLFSRDT